MSLSLSRANTILQKLGLPEIRAANHFEQTIDEYGGKKTWVIDQGVRQALKAYPTIREAFAEACNYGFELSHFATLTPKEQAIVDAVMR